VLVALSTSYQQRLVPRRSSAVMARDGLKQHVVYTRRLEETWGVNTLEELLRVQKELRRLEENVGG